MTLFCLCCSGKILICSRTLWVIFDCECAFVPLFYVCAALQRVNTSVKSASLFCTADHWSFEPDLQPLHHSHDRRQKEPKPERQSRGVRPDQDSNWLQAAEMGDWRRPIYSWTKGVIRRSFGSGLLAASLTGEEGGGPASHGQNQAGAE